MNASATAEEVLSNSFSIIYTANNHKLKYLLFSDSFSFFGTCIINAFDMNQFNNLKQALTYSHV